MSTSNANDKQVGGEHYRSDYQHWDFVCEMELHYLNGNSTKYVSRYRKKNGLQDLEKARHYIEKAREKKVQPKFYGTVQRSLVKQFVQFNELGKLETAVIEDICQGRYDSALYHLDGLIDGLKKRQERIDNTGQEHPFGYDEEEENGSNQVSRR